MLHYQFESEGVWRNKLIIGRPKLWQEINLNPGNIITSPSLKRLQTETVPHSHSMLFVHFKIQAEYNWCIYPKPSYCTSHFKNQNPPKKFCLWTQMITFSLWKHDRANQTERVDLESELGSTSSPTHSLKSVGESDWALPCQVSGGQTRWPSKSWSKFDILHILSVFRANHDRKRGARTGLNLVVLCLVLVLVQTLVQRFKLGQRGRGGQAATTCRYTGWSETFSSSSWTFLMIFCKYEPSWNFWRRYKCEPSWKPPSMLEQRRLKDNSK